MAMSSCPKCGANSFEMKESSPAGSRFKIMFIQCASCGTVVGVTDFHNIPILLNKIAKKLGVDLFGI